MERERERERERNELYWFLRNSYKYCSRVFVGTWNVAGRSPVGSLAVDLDEWLNLKDAADIYVLGYESFMFFSKRL